jgi:hypothetical protein
MMILRLWVAALMRLCVGLATPLPADERFTVINHESFTTEHFPSECRPHPPASTNAADPHQTVTLAKARTPYKVPTSQCGGFG